MVKKEYYGNESFGLAWDCVKVHQIGPFNATKMVKKLSKCVQALEEAGLLKTDVVNVLSSRNNLYIKKGHFVLLFIFNYK